MTSQSVLKEAIASSQNLIDEEFYSDTWRATSYLINLLGKLEDYCESLSEDNPDENFFTAQVACSSACSLISNSYNCEITDERFENVREMMHNTVTNFIKDLSDDATADLVYIGALTNYVAGMRTHAIDSWIGETFPSEEKFKMLKYAKRDEKAVELAMKALSDVLIQA